MTRHRHRIIQQAAALFLAAFLLSLAVGSAEAKAADTLEFGSHGPEVLALQKNLLSLGFDPNGADGKFGRGTESAVIAYQNSKKLKADGKAGAATLAAVNADITSQNAATGPAAAGSSNPNTLKYGDQGPRVTDLQTKLNQLGYPTNGIDGRFGAGTQRAVTAFQKANKMKADGLAGTQTLSMLEKLAGQAGPAAGGSASAGSTGANVASTDFNRTLRKGVTGADVSAAQTRLKALGYYAGNIDGVYGTGSVAAVTAFQKRNGLTADGLAGSQTIARLFSANAKPADGSGSSGAPDGGASGNSGGNGSGSSAGASGTYITLRVGSTGTEVRALQQALKNLNYNVSVDGSYGNGTRDAVIAFQKRNGLGADGVAGAATQARLFSSSALAAGPAEPAAGGSGSDGSGSGGSGNGGSGGNSPPAGAGQAEGPSAGSVKLLHWFNEIKPSLRVGQTLVIFDPATQLQWELKLYSLGRHADSEPKTLTDTQIMFKAFGNTNTWTPKPVYVKLPSGTWTLAAMHNVPHLSGSIANNGFNGHLCVHFFRDMDECRQTDPNYGVQNQETIRKKWKAMTGVTVP
ncbi:MAG: peptidoglycan-binding protein [Clostridia bacterium]|nr:peptidoglycan-binding protein [Clostridia bacterium]